MKEVDHILQNLLIKNKTPSVQYIIFDKDHVIQKFQAGYADIKNKKKVGVNSTFNGFSATKTFTALAILQLAEKQHFNINDSIKKYLPEFPYSPGITIRQLLAHSAGIPNPNPLSWVHLPAEHKTFDRNKFFYGIFTKYKKAKYKPNEKISYSNLGYVILGQLVEKVSGLKYEDYVRIHIIKPMGISPDELDFEFPDNGNQAKGYQKRYSLLNLILGFFMDKRKLMDNAEGLWKPFKPMFINGTSYGGLLGTPNAFMGYIRELLKDDCRLISPQYKEILFTENLTNRNKPTGMCLSWYKGSLNGKTYYCHAGGGGGYYCEIRIYPGQGIGSVIMFNRTGIKDERFLDKLDIYNIQ
jgi:CubicO group peptidase (beta-lactamase class C family)